MSTYSRSGKFVAAITASLLFFALLPTARGELVANWRLDEGSGDIFADNAGGFDGFLAPLAPEWTTDVPPTGS